MEFNEDSQQFDTIPKPGKINESKINQSSAFLNFKKFES